MRRLWALSLVFFFSFSLIAPALFASNPEENLPACCRRDGKHHCAMSGSPRAESQGLSLHAAPCSAYPTPQAFPSRITPVAASFPQVAARLAPNPEFLASGRETRCQLRSKRSSPKRGPPAVQL
ncbi:MAG TPA: hypothetical protein VLT57_01330 [Bryobacteraceae bacterium]|nr:hypothetical protein [Bryobacteraceae bacterium]